MARPAAYPESCPKGPGWSVRPPLAWEPTLLVGRLRTIPQFVARPPQGDPAREVLTLPGATGELQLVLSWVAE